MRNVFALALVVAIIATAWYLHGVTTYNEANTTNVGPIYIIYSPTCPHCQHLKELLSQYNDINIVYIDILNINETLKRTLLHYNVPIYGTPTTFIVTRDNKTYVVIGYPTRSQDVNGYFYGRDKESWYCKEMNGTSYYINNTYAFCILKTFDNTTYILGNKYAIQYIIDTCKKKGCIDIFKQSPFK